MGKGGGASASLVDPSAAMESYQKAADVIEQQFPQALQQYMGNARSGLAAQLEQYGKAQSAAAPFSSTARDAVNELRQWLGMPGLSKSLGLSDQMQSYADGWKAYMGTTMSGGGAGGGAYASLNNIANQMSLAEDLTDPGQRAAAKENILNQMTSLNNAMKNELIANANAARYRDLTMSSKYTNPGVYNNVSGVEYTGDSAIRPVYANGKLGFEGLPEGAKPEDYGYKSYLPTDMQGQMTPLSSYINKLTSSTDLNENDNGARLNMMQRLSDQISQSQSQLEAMQDTFSSKYSIEAPKALTGDEIMSKLEATPGYSVNLEQGQKALERTQAARGILQSGNAAIEAQKFGADYATQAYQQQIGNLSQLAGINMPVAQQSIGNYSNLGNNLQNQYNQMGQTAQTSYQDIARSRESAFIRSGDAQLQAAMMNAQLKTQANMQNAASGGQGLGQLAGIAASLFL